MGIVLDKRATDSTLDVACVPNAADRGTDLPKAGALPPKAVRQVVTARFGALEVEEDLILTLPEGLIGFDTCRDYIVVRNDEASAFRWLQSLDEPAIAFPILEPKEFRPDYAPTIADADARALELTPQTPTLIFAIVTVPAQNPRAMTANLLGPVVINGLTRQGKQVIVQDPQYTTRHEIMEELARASEQPVLARRKEKVEQAAGVTL